MYDKYNIHVYYEIELPHVLSVTLVIQQYIPLITFFPQYIFLTKICLELFRLIVSKGGKTRKERSFSRRQNVQATDFIRWLSVCALEIRLVGEKKDCVELEFYSVLYVYMFIRVRVCTLYVTHMHTYVHTYTYTCY